MLAAFLPSLHTLVMKKRERGFSLMEVMLVMMIVAALAVGGVQSWHGWQQKQRLWITVQQVRLLFEQLRSEANWKNRDNLLSLSRSGSRWYLGRLNPADKPYEGSSALQLAQPFAEVDIVDITPGLGFYGQRNTAWPGHVTLKSPAGEWRVILSAWGRIRTCNMSEVKKCS